MKDNFKGLVSEAAGEQDVVVGFNVFGYEDACTMVRAAERMGRPILLMVNRAAAEQVPVEYWGMMLTYLAEQAAVPVGVHLDHCSDYGLIVRAMRSGFSSVMYDGSMLPLEENIKRTNEIVKIAAELQITVEGEVGSVPYFDRQEDYKNVYTDTEEARRYAEETGVDWIAIAVGQIHRLQAKKAVIQFDRLEKIQEAVEKPLVIHGCSGIPTADIRRLCSCRVGKMNFGTSVKMAFAEALRKDLENYREYDYIKMFGPPMEAVRRETERILDCTAGRGRHSGERRADI